MRLHPTRREGLLRSTLLTAVCMYCFMYWYYSLSLNPFPDVAALMDLPYISRCSSHSPATPPCTPHPSPKIAFLFVGLPLYFFGLSLFFVVLISPVFGVFLYVRNNLIFAFNIYSSSGVLQMLCFCLGSTFHIRMWQLEICMFVLSVNSYSHGIFLFKQAL